MEPHLTKAQRDLLSLACTVGLKRSPTGQARCPPYSRIALNALIDKGLVNPDWQPTKAGRAVHEQTAEACRHTAAAILNSVDARAAAFATPRNI